MLEKNEIVIFETEDSQISLSVPVENEMVWLSANQMAALFERDEKTIRKHINNVFFGRGSEPKQQHAKNAC